MTEFNKPSQPRTTPGRRGTAEDRAQVPRDQWDRYLIPGLDGTKPSHNKGRTRVSTTKQALSNTIGIQKWTNRLTAEGVASNDQIRTAILDAMELVEADRKKKVGALAGEAFTRAGGKDKSNLGTAVHDATERINKGETDVQVPTEHKASVDAYYQLLHEHNVRILPNLMERVVLCPYNNGGTLDNIVEWWNPDTEEFELVAADLKTGRDLTLGALEILIQLWMYANALGLWTTTKVVYSDDPATPDLVVDVEGFYEPMPRELRRDKALIFHVPMDGTARLHVLDLGGVDKWVEAAVTAKRANAEAVHKFRLVGEVKAPAFVTDAGRSTNLEPSADEHARAQANVQRVADQAAPWLADSDDPLKAASEAMGRINRPTPDQQAQVDKAAERLDKVTNIGSVADKQVTPEPERDPVTGRKKRTCGFCHKPGHVQKNCPENPASTKYVPPAAAAALAEGADPADPRFSDGTTRLPGDPVPENNCNCQRDGDWHPYVHGMCNPAGPFAADSADGDDAPPPPKVDHLLDARQAAIDKNPPPWCTVAHTCEWTSTHPAAPGHWVCSISGKPGKQAYESGQTQVTGQSPTYGAPASNVWPPPQEYRVIDPDPVLAAVFLATTRTEIIQIRQNAIQAGTWDNSIHDHPAMERYQSLP